MTSLRGTEEWLANYQRRGRATVTRLLDPENITEDDVVQFYQELMRVACERVCDDVDTILAQGRTDAFWAGVSTACEEIKHRIGEIDLAAFNPPDNENGVSA